MRCVPRASILLLLFAAGPGGPRAQEAQLLSREAGGLLELQGERRLEVEGVHGSVSVRLGKNGELRFAARDLGGEQGERPVALWVDGQVLRLTAVEGDPGTPMRLEVAVGPELDTRLDVSNSELKISGLHGSVEVRGADLELSSRTLDASLALDVDRVRGHVIGVADELSIEGEKLDLRLGDVGGPVSLEVGGGSEIQIDNARSDVEGGIEHTSLRARTVVGRVTLDGDESSMSLEACTGGAELSLRATRLDLQGTAGAFEVDTDADVRFQGHEGMLTIRGHEAGVLGNQAKGGKLSIETTGAEVRLEQIESAATVRGDTLEVHVTDPKGELTVATVYSTVTIENATTPVAVENEFGDIQVRAAQQPVTITSRDGEVHIDELAAPVQVTADGGVVEVNWATLVGTDTSVVENSRGDVRVSVPDNVRCRIDAEAPHGRVETDIEEMEFSEDGHFAAGLLRGGRGPAPRIKVPTIRIKSSGDVYVHARTPSEGQ